MKKKLKLYKRRKKYRKLKTKKKGNIHNKKIYKFIFLCFSFNFIFYSYNIFSNVFHKFSFGKNDTNNNWISNMTKFTNYFMSNYNIYR